MIGFQTKEQLIGWLEGNSPSQSVSRALRSDQPILLLGAFKPVPESNWPGWIVRVATRVREYYVAVSIRSDGRRNAYLVPYIDWKCYDGDRSENPLYAGDRPEKAVALKRSEKLQRVNDGDDKQRQDA